MHAQGLHHHDIHPRNLVRGESGDICIIDFGMSVPSSQCEQTSCEDKMWILDDVEGAPARESQSPG
jgi:tRNA A-37 threonylcarbamoyl transferase component Bud32